VHCRLDAGRWTRTEEANKYKDAEGFSELARAECLALGLKMGVFDIQPCPSHLTWDFVVLGISAYSIHQCVPELFLEKIGRVLVNLQE
jgi:hypothetical protein